MALTVKDRVKVTSTSTGTGTITLGSASAGYQDFSVIGDGNTTYYAIVDNTNNAWEVGIGTYTASGTTLSRTTVLESSNSGSLVDFAAGEKNVFVTYPAERSVYTSAVGNLLLGGAAEYTSTSVAGAEANAGLGIYPYPLSGTTNTNVSATQVAIPTITTGRGAGMVSVPQVSTASTGVQFYYGQINNPSVVTTVATTRPNVMGSYNVVYRNSATDIGTLANLYGVYGDAATGTSLAATATTTSIYGGRFAATNNTTVGTMYGAYAAAIVNKKVTTVYGQTASVTVNNQDTVDYTISATLGMSVAAQVTNTSTSTGNLTVTKQAACDASVSITNQAIGKTLYTPSVAAINANLALITTNTDAGSITVDNFYGINFTGLTLSNNTPATATVTVGNAYGCYIGNFTAGSDTSFTNKWGAYQTDTTAPNYFASELRVGTTANTNGSKIVAAGVVESTTGGFRFPDGTTQTTAGLTSVDLTADVTGTLPVANGGTGATTLTANSVLLGNNGAALQTVAPGTSGNVLTSNGTTWTSAAPPASAGTITAVASGSLSDGSLVVVNSDGTVSAVASTLSNPPTTSGKSAFVSSVGTSSYQTRIVGSYDVNNKKIVVIYTNSSGYIVGIAGSVSGSTITFGLPTVLYSYASQRYFALSYSTSAGVFLLSWSDVYQTRGVSAVVTVSGTNISMGTPALFQSSDIEYVSSAYHVAQDKFVVAYRHNGASGRGYAIAASISGTTVTYGAGTQFEGTAIDYTTLTYDTAQQKCLLTFKPSSGYGRALVVTVSGTTLSYGAGLNFTPNTNFSYPGAAYDPISGKHLVAYSGTSGYGYVVVLTVSGTTVTAGTPVNIAAQAQERFSCAYDSIANRVLVSYVYGGMQPQVVQVAISGTVPTVGTSATLGGLEYPEGVSNVYDPVAGKVVVIFDDSANNGDTNIVTSGVSNLTTSNFIGVSSAAYTNGQTATIQTIGAVDDAQSGLTAGLKYYVTPTGTLSTTDSGVFAGTAISATKLIVKG